MSMKFGPWTGNARDAFTLIELMVVIVLIGILSAMIIPEMKGTFEGALLRSTSRKLVDVFNLAYSRSVSLDQLHCVRLDPRTGRYLVERRAGEDPDDHYIPLTGVPGCEGTLDSRIAIQILSPAAAAPDSSAQPATLPATNESEMPSQNEAICFYPDGTADVREVLLRDREGFRLALRINPITARVHVVDLGRE